MSAFTLQRDHDGCVGFCVGCLARCFKIPLHPRALRACREASAIEMLHRLDRLEMSG